MSDMETEEATILADRECVLGLEPGKYYHHLWRHLVLMQDTLHELRVLLKVRKGELIVPLPLGKRFFRMVWGAYGRDLIHGISALADPAQDNRFNNMSLEGLKKKLKLNSVVSGAFEQALEAFKEAAKPLVTYRNKRLAHFDAEVILNGTANEVSVTLDRIEDCLTKACEVLNAVEWEHFQHSRVAYADPWAPPGGIETLINMLPKVN